MPTRIHLCGDLSIEIDGARLEGRLPGRQGRALFAYLVISRHGRRRREELIEAIWPDQQPRAADGALRSLLSKLRTALGSVPIQGRESVLMALPESAWVDVEAAAEAAHRAEAATLAEDWGEVWGAARVALSVTDRGFLPDHDAPWVAERRRELDDLADRADHSLVACGLALGGHELLAADRATQRLVRRRPLDDAAVAARMRVLVARGSPAEALRTYEELRVRVREELGSVPGQAARELHARLLNS